MNKDTEHLGDGVYVSHDGYQLWLRANNGHWGKASETPEVALERRVLVRLLEYATRHGYIKSTG